MVSFLLINWRWLLPSVIAVGLGIMLGLTQLKLDAERLVRAQERQAAAEFALKAEAAAREKDNKNAELTSKLDANHAQYLKSIEATRGDFERRLAIRLRERRPACPDGLPAPAVDPGEPADDAAGSDDEPGRAAFDAGRRLRSAIAVLQSTVQTCVSWAGQVGR